MSDLKKFFFRGDEVRVVLDENGEPLFVAKDVAQALGYPESSLKQLANLIGSVPEEWKGINRINTLRGGEQDMLILTEQGLYFFLCRSDKPKARPFQKWLAGIVLPSIRRTGSYSLPKAPLPAPAAPEAPAILSRLGLPEDVLMLNRSLRVRLMSIAARIALMDPEQEERAFATFGKLCSIVTARGKDVQTGSPAADFARERLAPSREQIQARNLYEAFKDWCYSRDVPPCSMRRFCMILRGFFPVRESNRTYFLCRFRSEADRPAALTPEVIA